MPHRHVQKFEEITFKRIIKAYSQSESIRFVNKTSKSERYGYIYEI